MPESMDLIEDWNQWTLDSLGSTHAITNGTIIGPEKPWGKFRFTPMFGLVEEIRSRHDEDVVHETALITMNQPSTQLSYDADLQSSQEIQHNYNIVTPQREGSLRFSSTRDIEQMDYGFETDVAMNTSVQHFTPTQDSSQMIHDFECPPGPPRISRVISAGDFRLPLPLNVENMPSQDKLGILVQAVDLVTLDEAAEKNHADDDSWTDSSHGMHVHTTLRMKRNRRLKPLWNTSQG